MGGNVWTLSEDFFFPLTFPAYSVSSCFKTRSLTQLLMTTHTMTFHPDTEHTHTQAHAQTLEYIRTTVQIVQILYSPMTTM